MLKRKTPLIYLLIFLISIDVFATVESGNKCSEPVDAPLSHGTTSLFTEILLRTDRDKCIEGPLKDVSVNDAMMEKWRIAADKFCNADTNGEYCQYTKINPLANEVGKKLLEFIQSDVESAALRPNAETEVPIYLCMMTIFNEMKENLFKESTSFEDAQKNIDLILSKIDEKLKVVFLREMLISHEDHGRNGREWYESGVRKMNYIMEKMAELSPSESSQIHVALKEILERRRYSDDVKKKVLEVLHLHASRGHNPSLITLTEISTSEERGVTDVVKAEASSLIAKLAATPSAIPGGGERAPASDDGRMTVSENLLPPNCSDWSDSKMNDALFLSESKISDFYSFFQDKYDVDLSSFGASEDISKNSFSKFKELIVPNVESSDAAEKMKWATFKERYAQSNVELNSDQAKSEAEAFYCRMHKLNDIYDELNKHPGDKNKKIKLLRLLSQLPKREAWYIIEKTLDGENDNDIIGNYIATIKRMGGSTAQIYLDKIFLKFPARRTEVIEAFDSPSIKLSMDSKIFEELGKTKEEPGTQQQIKRLIEILDKKEKERLARVESASSMASLLNLETDKFIEQISPQYTPHDFSKKSKSEVTAEITALNTQKGALESEISAERQKLIDAINKGEGDTSIILARIEDLQRDLETVQEKVFSAKIQQRLLELNSLDDPTALQLAKATIIEDLSKFLQQDQSGSTDNGNMAVLMAIKEMVISDANAGADDPNGGTSATAGNNGTPVNQNGDPDDRTGRPHVGVDPDSTTHSGVGAPFVDDGHVSPHEEKEGTPITGGLGSPERSTPVDTVRDSERQVSSVPVTGSNIPEVSDATIKNNNSNFGGGINLNSSTSPTSVTAFAPDSEETEEVDSDSGYKIEFIKDKKVAEVKAEVVQDQRPVVKVAPKQMNDSEKFTETKMEVTRESDSSKPSFKSSASNGLKNEIADLQKEVNNLQVSNAQLQNKKLEQQLQETLAANAIAQGEINRNIAAVSPGTAAVKSGRAPASAPIGEGGSAGSALSSGGSVRAPSSNENKLERKVIPEGQIDMASIGTRFVKDLDEKEADKMGVMSVVVSNKSHEEHLLSLLSNPETATCNDLKFLDVFFKEHIAKVKFNKQGDAELLVKSGNIPLRVIKPSEKKVLALESKFCGMANTDENNTRHTSSIGADLENLPEEGVEKVKPIVRERSESGALSRIIDGIKGFFN
ncbi:MAG: hypothetical protein EP319_15815 [Deltaproteobacteria bacterium]|nr:MAG: hypothetical protein EP319_15815 [Deltaproteobacteria bacterium]